MKNSALVVATIAGLLGACLLGRRHPQVRHFEKGQALAAGLAAGVALSTITN